MRIIRRLDIFVMRNFLQLFAGTFCICLFVVMMQFLWRYVDELIGKGLSMLVLLKFLLYSGATLVSLALPLAILLASLISFGNMGERLELLSIKAAGISLFRTMRSLIVLNVFLALASFYFQNNIAPAADLKLMQLLYSIRTKSPELDIPEGVFYDGIKGVNLFVRHKNPDTGMLYNVTIYDLRNGISNSHIILSDSGRMETTYDKKALLLHLYNGEQFENLQNNPLMTNNVPYRRETFVQKRFIIDFDMNLNMMEEDDFASSESVKNMVQLQESIDSLSCSYDSISNAYYTEAQCMSLFMANTTKAKVRNYETGEVKDIAPEKIVHVTDDTLTIDRVFAGMDAARQQRAVQAAFQRTSMMKMDTEYKSLVMDSGNINIRRHQIAYWSKITMALACLLFFFIGAPLGAIIRKGGLGLPVVVSVVIFIIYYIINTSGMRIGREGAIPVWVGMWISSIIMVPVGMFLTVKSNNDSAVFNMDAYRAFFRRLAGIRLKRHIVRKEVIINDPDYEIAAAELQDIMLDCYDYLRQCSGRQHPLAYLMYIVRRPDESAARQISDRLEQLIEMLSNSKDRHVLLMLNGFPILTPDEFRFYRRRRGDMKAILKYGDLLLLRIEEMTGKPIVSLSGDIASAVALGEQTELDAEEERHA